MIIPNVDDPAHDPDWQTAQRDDVMRIEITQGMRTAVLPVWVARASAAAPSRTA
jgi:hypothetical protein